MYVRCDTGDVVTHEVRHSVMMLTKILFRFDIIDEEQALNIATKFQIFFV